MLANYFALFGCKILSFTNVIIAKHLCKYKDMQVTIILVTLDELENKVQLICKDITLYNRVLLLLELC